ncbi:hypothetical protein ABTM36_20345, partial [Acinetobacter baumannii]
GNFLSNSAQVLTEMKDVGSFANDLTLTGKFAAGEGAKITAHAGWFLMRQNIAMDWHVNNATQSLNSSGNPVPLDLFDAAGNQL